MCVCVCACACVCACVCVCSLEHFAATMYLLFIFSCKPTAFVTGDPYRLIFSVDSQGRVCGRDPGVE